MNPADERVQVLLDKWLESLELHLKYVALSEADYRKAQPWPEHDRPSRWIIEVAKGKASELRDQVAARINAGDASFSQSLELMAFLVNLVGARVDRFVPLAEAASDVDVATAKQPATAAPVAPAPRAAPAIVTAPAPTPAVPSTPAPEYTPPPSPVFSAPPPVRRPVLPAAPAPAPIGPARTTPAIAAAPVVLAAPVSPPPPAPPVVQAPPPPPASPTAVRLTESGELRALAAQLDATREMTRPATGAVIEPPDAGDTVETPRARTDARKVTRRETKSRAPGRESHAKEKDMSAMVVADAVRLIVWGRKWHELVELIGRFAERPSATEIRRILKEHRAAIEKTAEKERSKKKK